MQDGYSSIAGVDSQALRQVVEPVLYAHGAVLVDLSWKPERRGWVFRVAIEVAGSTELGGGVTVDLCATISRDLSAALDVAEILTHPYVLEVTSPGVERPLRRLEEFARFAGREAKLVLTRTESGPSAHGGTIEGVLVGVENEQVLVQVGETIERIYLAQLKFAHLVFSFGVASRGKGQSSGLVKKERSAQRPGKRPGKTQTTETKHEQTGLPRARTAGTE